MVANNSDIIADLTLVSERILALEKKVADLHDKVCRLDALKGGENVVDVAGGADPSDPVAILEPAEGFGEWVNKGALLQKLAAVCFILVFALLLRTVTDYGYINIMAGSLLGLGYVSILAISGCVFYVTGGRMANVFSISGFLLLFTIVFEGHQRFGTIPAGVAFLILLTALLTSTAVAIKYRVSRLLSVSIIGVAVAGMAIDFPDVIFPMSGALFLIGNSAAFIASERGFAEKLKWPVTILTLLFVALWSFKAYAPLDRGESVPAQIYPVWLAPFLLSFVGLYLAFYLKRYLRSDKSTAYDAVLPSINILMFFLAGGVVARYWQQPGWILGLLTILAGGGHFVLGWKLLAGDRSNKVGAGGCFVAGLIAVALGAPALFGGLAWAIPLWAILAYLLARLSQRLGSGMIRILSYLYPLFALLIGLALDVYEIGHKGGGGGGALAAAAALALIGLSQFKWCRRNPPPAGTMFADLDGDDRSAVVLLLIGLAGLYLLANTILGLVAPVMLTDPANTIKCGKSILINIGAISMLISAGLRHDREAAWIAVALAIVGCMKVFLVDLFNTNGIPLVLSVLSFGMVAMTGSIVMGRWKKPYRDNPV